MQRLSLLLLSSLSVTLFVEPSFADDKSNRAFATDLFDKAVTLMDGGHCFSPPIQNREKCEQARDLLQRAFKLYPQGLGALRNLAFVERTLGLYASAQRSFLQLVRLASNDSKEDRRAWVNKAQLEAEAIAPMVPSVKIRVNSGANHLKIWLNDILIPPETWNSELSVDPGKHRIRAEADEMEPFMREITLEEGKSKTITISLTSKRSTEQHTEGRVTNKKPVSIPRDEAPMVPQQRSLLGPSILMISGGVVFTAGLFIGYSSLRVKATECNAAKECNAGAIEKGRNLAHASTALTLGGAAAGVGGLLWLLFAPSSKGQTAQISPWFSAQSGGVYATGVF